MSIERIIRHVDTVIEINALVRVEEPDFSDIMITIGPFPTQLSNALMEAIAQYIPNAIDNLADVIAVKDAGEPKQ